MAPLFGGHGARDLGGLLSADSSISWVSLQAWLLQSLGALTGGDSGPVAGSFKVMVMVGVRRLTARTPAHASAHEADAERDLRMLCSAEESEARRGEVTRVRSVGR